MKALVVDDSRAMRTILSRILRTAGAETIGQAGDGLEALAYLESATELPDLALVDWNMPNMNGLDLVSALRRRTEWRRIAIVMVTTENEHNQVVRALAAGAHEYLIKPFDEGSLLEKLAILGFEVPEPAGTTELVDNFVRGYSVMTLLTSEAVTQLTQEIWAALFDPDGSAELLPGELPGYDVVARTEISGAWNGTVCLSCSRRAARHATSAMFDLPDDELTQADINDAVGELVNVVGGNIKSLLPGPSVLSLPIVSEDGLPVLPGHLELAQEVCFSWMAEPVVVTVWADATDQLD